LVKNLTFTCGTIDADSVTCDHFVSEDEVSPRSRRCAAIGNESKNKAMAVEFRLELVEGEWMDRHASFSRFAPTLRRFFTPAHVDRALVRVFLHFHGSCSNLTGTVIRVLFES
jgi:hypothetical protein